MAEQLTVGSLFTGIGGFDLGLERAGMRTLWFCEQDDYCRRVLAKHWPDIPCHPDVRALVADAAGSGQPAQHAQCAQSGCVGPTDSTNPSGRTEHVPVPVPYVDVLCGGFPCQDLSYAGKGAGIDGERSGLWSEFARLIRDLQPRYVLVENVPALLSRGLGRVLGDLAAIGYDAEWDCIRASDVGAPHRRDRVWIVAYPQREQLREQSGRQRRQSRSSAPLAAVNGEAQPLANSDSAGRGEQRWLEPVRAQFAAVERGGEDPDPDCESSLWPPVAWAQRNPWLAEPDVGRVANGIPYRVDRLRSLGNALVPQIAEWLGHRIMEYEATLESVT